MLELVEGVGNCQNIPRQKGEELAASLVEDIGNAQAEPAIFWQLAWPAYFKCVQDSSYYSSCEELL